MFQVSNVAARVPAQTAVTSAQRPVRPDALNSSIRSGVTRLALATGVGAAAATSAAGASGDDGGGSASIFSLQEPRLRTKAMDIAASEPVFMESGPALGKRSQDGSIPARQSEPN